MSSDALYSPLWYRIAQLRPRLRPHVEVHRHQYRGQIWFVLSDRAASRHHRLAADGWFLVGLMDGKRSADEIWERALDRLGGDAPTQDHAIRLLAQLHAADMLVCDVSPSTADLFRRYREERRSRWQQQARSPLAIRVPLIDPGRFLNMLGHLANPMFSRAGIVVWLLLVTAAAVLALLHAPDLRAEFATHALSPGNLVILWLLYPIIKALHELGHGLAVRRWGGEVHEMGVILLALVPLPYVDASGASAFRDKYRRMLVGAAGIMVELGIAALALFFWLAVDPGLLRSIAFDALLIGGFSTILFNGNPLLRFDGYYILADAIEIPNLAPRSNRYLAYLTMRYAFGVNDMVSPASGRGEAAWFVVYGCASFVYRLVVVFAIAWYLSTSYPLVGGLLAVWASVAYVLLPLYRGVKFLAVNQRIAKKRLRAIGATGTLALAITLAVFVIPMPLATHAEGFVALPEDARLRPANDCFVVEMLAEPGTEVETGAPIVRCEDPLLRAKIALLRATVQELSANERALAGTDRTGAAVFAERRDAVQAELSNEETRERSLTLFSPAAGRFIVPDHRSLVGRFVPQGEVLGLVLNPSQVDVRVIVPQSEMGLIRQHLASVDLRFAHQPGLSVPAKVAREYPTAADRLPSLALGTAGGGRIAVDPRDEEGERTLETFYQLDLQPAAEYRPDTVGQRVYARFDHGDEVLAARLQRRIKRLFLGRNNG